MKKSKKSAAAKVALPDTQELDRIKTILRKERVDVEALLKAPALIAHAHVATARWVLASGAELSRPANMKSVVEAFEHALAHRGRLLRGVAIGSKEHAAALAGAALWRHFNPSQTKGGPGRGQGRKAVDGCTDLNRVTVTMRGDQRADFKALGGSAWLRQQIDREVGQQASQGAAKA